MEGGIIQGGEVFNFTIKMWRRYNLRLLVGVFNFTIKMWRRYNLRLLGCILRLLGCILLLLEALQILQQVGHGKAWTSLAVVANEVWVVAKAFQFGQRLGVGQGGEVFNFTIQGGEVFNFTIKKLF